MSSKPIYLYVTPFFPSDDNWRGGYCFDAVEALRRVGEYDVYVIRTGSTDVDYDYNGVRVYCLKRLKLPFDCAPFLLTRINGFLLKRKLKRIGVNIRDISICHSNVYPEYSFILKAANSELTAIWQTHSHWMGAPFSLWVYRLGVVKGLSDLLYLYWRKMLEAMDVVVLLSELHMCQFGKAYPEGTLGSEIDMREQTFFKKYRKISPKKMVVFYNGINTDVFRKESEKGVCEGRGSFVIGCVANFGLTKGQMTLLKAAKRIVAAKTIPELHVKLVGSGPELDRCRAYVRENGLGEVVEFIKECDHLKLPAFYRSLDLFVLPTWQEGFCCTLVEAVGCGVPAMATKAVSFAEVIPEEDREKWLVEPRNDEELAKKIERFYRNRETFKFNRSMDINDLWKDFLDEI